MKKLKDAQDHYASSGVTTAAEHLAIPDKVVLLEKAAAEKRIYIDLMVTPGFMMAKEVLGTGRIKWREYSNHLNFVGLKMAVDGSPQGKTAFLTKPYLTPVPGCTKDCRGFSNMTQEQVDQLMLACYKNNVQLYSHCNGDASIDMMIKGHENAVKVLGDSTTDRRTVIIHSQIMRPDQLEKYKKYHMIPSFFTNHTYYWGDVHLANLGKERGGYISPMRAAIDKGVIATNHTDFIVTPLDQLFLLWTSVNRLSRTGQPVGEGQRITPYEGLRALTAYGAYEYFEEKSKGTLEAGKIADLVILDKNPLKVDPAAIRDIKVVETIKEGKTIYRK
jgi:predicted amidohydrolase YtcJ